MAKKNADVINCNTMIAGQRPISGVALRILEFILREADCGRLPTIREIGAVVELRNPHAVVWHLDRLRRHGLVTWEDRKKRTLRPTCRFVPIGELRDLS